MFFRRHPKASWRTGPRTLGRSGPSWTPPIHSASCCRTRGTCGFDRRVCVSLASATVPVIVGDLSAHPEILRSRASGVERGEERRGRVPRAATGRTGILPRVLTSPPAWCQRNCASRATEISASRPDATGGGILAEVRRWARAVLGLGAIPQIGGAAGPPGLRAGRAHVWTAGGEG